MESFPPPACSKMSWSPPADKRATRFPGKSKCLLAARLKTPSLVAAEVTRLSLAEGIVGQSEPPYVGCYFFNRLNRPAALTMRFFQRIASFALYAARKDNGKCRSPADFAGQCHPALVRFHDGFDQA